MRSGPLLLEQRAQERHGRVLVRGDLLGSKIGLFVCHEVEGELVAVLPEKAAGEALVDPPLGKRVSPNEAHDVISQARRIAEAFECLPRPAGAAFGVLARVARPPPLVPEGGEAGRGGWLCRPP